MSTNNSFQKEFVIYEDSLRRMAGLSYLYNSPSHVGPYIFQHEGRICYPYFNILCEPNTQYKIVATVSQGFENAQMGVQQFSKEDYARYLQNRDFSSVYIDSGWKNLTYTFTTGSQARGFRVIFRQYGQGYYPINPNFRILKVVITKV